MREALELVDDDTDRLLASRVYSSYAVLCEEFEGQMRHHEALELAIEYAAGPPSEELASALSTMAMWHLRMEKIAGTIRYADQGDRRWPWRCPIS